LIKKKNIIFLILFFFFLFLNNSQASLQEKLILKMKETETLSFNFVQKIADNKEVGICFIKYPLLMKCNYKNEKKKIIISNGKTVAVIKKKYKKIYYYPLKSTPLFTILEKEKILNLIKNNNPTKIDSKIIQYELIDKNSKILKLFFDKITFEFKGWETIDAYSNVVSFSINNLKENIQINNNFFKIPKEEDL